MVSLGEELRKLRARHKTAWMLEWGLGNSFQKGFRLQVNGGLSWGLFEAKVGEVKEGQGRNLLGGGGIEGAA